LKKSALSLRLVSRCGIIPSYRKLSIFQFSERSMTLTKAQIVEALFATNVSTMKCLNPDLEGSYDAAMLAPVGRLNEKFGYPL
jgi:hypothetical protein